MTAARRLVRGSHPGFREAVSRDVMVALAFRGEPSVSGCWMVAIHCLRLMWVSDAFAAQVAYRVRCWAVDHSVPLVPTLLHRFSMIWAQVCIGDPVVIGAGLYLPHGGVVIDGITRVGRDVVVFPGVTLGLVAGEFVGPTIGDRARIGTGAKVIGPVSVGDGAQVGANAVVISDVPSGGTAVGVPARVIAR